MLLHLHCVPGEPPHVVQPGPPAHCQSHKHLSFFMYHSTFTVFQVNHRMWSSQNPLRQFKVLAKEVLSRLEKKDLAWERYYDLSPEELGELVSIWGLVLRTDVLQLINLRLGTENLLCQKVAQKTLQYSAPDDKHRVGQTCFSECLWVCAYCCIAMIGAHPAHPAYTPAAFVQNLSKGWANLVYMCVYECQCLLLHCNDRCASPTSARPAGSCSTS